MTTAALSPDVSGLKAAVGDFLPAVIEMPARAGCGMLKIRRKGTAMPSHGTAHIQWELEQQNEVLVAVVRAMPQALQEMDPKQLLASLEGHGQAIERGLAEMFAALLDGEETAAQGKSTPFVVTYPAVGEVFDLTLDGDAPEHQPLEMVRRDGYTGKWEHRGPVVKGKQARRFKLVQIGYCPSFDEVRRKLATEHGKIPEGQWREAFKAAYPKADGNGPVGVADSSWVNPNGNANFPYVNTDGNSNFNWTDDDFNENWRWLVEVSNLRSYSSASLRRSIFL